MSQNQSATLSRSTPSFSDFDPSYIPYQDTVVDDVDNYDYSLGTHEVLLSGSVGCLREDALVETASGPVPISDIKQSDYLVSYHAKKNQFCLALSSGAYPKGKDYLYRVIGEHGEFVAAGNHLIATSPDTYCKVSDLLGLEYSRLPAVLSRSHLSSDRLLCRVGVLRCSHILASFLVHCATRIHQGGLPLPSRLSTVLGFFPLQGDAQEFGQWFCLNGSSPADDQLERALVHGHTVESPFHRSMLHCADLLAGRVGALEGVCSPGGLELYARKLSENLVLALSQTQSAHPQEILSGLSYLLPALLELLSFEVGYTNSAIVAVERLDKEEWYWDIQVPNTHNYIANGYQHHNSAKSILMAHLAIKHCLSYPRARVLLGRRALPDLKSTIFQKILEHMEGSLKEGVHYNVNRTSARIIFYNGSEIVSRSWADKHYSKMRSLEISMAVIEELSENNEDDKQAYLEIKMRVGRLPHVPQKIIIAATNPDSPTHWVYKYFITAQSETKHVYYSVTTDNPFLPPEYIAQLQKDLDPRMARRMIHGEWLEIASESLYYAYDSTVQYRKNEAWDIISGLPIILSWDFNIAAGKPISAVAMQYIKERDEFHVFKEVVVHGGRTADTVEEFSGILSPSQRVIVCGDASGKHRDTRSSVSDYDIIMKALRARNIQVEYHVPLSNPPIRTRHNTMNAYCLNSEGKRRLTVYQGCEVTDEGLRLTRLKPGANYIEDDSKHYQHVTTALGYAIVYESTFAKSKPQGTVIL